ncbi:helix-turn-helix domain-containing protein [Spirosoma areae]
MDIIVMPAEQVRTMMIEAASLAVKHNLPPAPLSSNSPEPVSPEELCKRLEISKPTAWAWEKKGIICGYHLGNRKYFIWQEVMSSLKKAGESA